METQQEKDTWESWPKWPSSLECQKVKEDGILKEDRTASDEQKSVVFCFF